jgi:NAD+ synthetase
VTNVDQLTREVRSWFKARELQAAVVGFSGGIDSTTTCALLAHSGINLTLVVAEAPNQTYSSPYGGFLGARRFLEEAGLVGEVIPVRYNHLFEDAPANEAAAPILRLAVLYGIAARQRTLGLSPIVVGTVNFDEAAYLGFWGKASDGAQDLYILSHLHKSEVMRVALELRIPEGITNAKPSGDLLFRNTNDFEMIGASYPNIEALARAAESGHSAGALAIMIEQFENPHKFARQVMHNRFKYELAFPGFHLSDRLERFRIKDYSEIVRAIEIFNKGSL